MNSHSRAAPARQMSREDWAAAGLKMLARHGVGGIRLDALCRRLGVTKGSLYWHFSNRSDLVAAILDHWRRTTTEQVIERLAASGGGPRERLRGLFEQGQRGAIDFAAEQAVRHWAASDRVAAEAVCAVDRERLDYMVAQYRGLGLSPAMAADRAALYYAFILGEAMIHRRESAQARRRRHDMALEEFLSSPVKVDESICKRE